MPGYASWKTLYTEEFSALFEEGYQIPRADQPSSIDVNLPFPEGVKTTDTTDSTQEAEWERFYWRLWSLRDKGMRSDYPYVEPMELDAIFAEAPEPPKLSPLSSETYRERIEGAWLGKCAGVVLGKPLEMGWDRKKIREYLESVDSYPLTTWVPKRSDKLGIELRKDCVSSTRGHIEFVQTDDDIHYTVLAILLAEKYGAGFTKKDVVTNWVDNVPYHWFWCASRQAYYRFVTLDSALSTEVQLDRIPYELNPWRESIDGQLRGDLWGYVHPGEPRRAGSAAYTDCSASLIRNGVYGGMFVAGCLAGALSASPSVDAILDSGLSVIPRLSRLAEAVNFVRETYGKTHSWEATDEAIDSRYGHLYFAATMNNLAKVTLALVHGNLDYSKTICTANMCGTDTDCNSGTAGTIVGAAIGAAGIPPHWYVPFKDTVKTVVSDFGQGTITELVKRTVALKGLPAKATE